MSTNLPKDPPICRLCNRETALIDEFCHKCAMDLWNESRIQNRFLIKILQDLCRPTSTSETRTFDKKPSTPTSSPSSSGVYPSEQELRRQSIDP